MSFEYTHLVFLTFIAPQREVLYKLASFPPVARDALEVKSEPVGSKCDFVNVALFVIFVVEKTYFVFDGNSCPIQFFQDKAVISENTFFSNSCTA